MGACDSSLENHEKFINSHISNQFSSEFLSSNSLPSLANKNLFSKGNNLLSLRKNNSNLSTNSSENIKYILSDTISIRDDVTKKYKLGKRMLGDGATSIVYVAENSEKKKFAIKRIKKDNIIPNIMKYMRIYNI